MDVRFLPNPYFVDTLRGRTGLDPEVAVFVLERNESKEFLQSLVRPGGVAASRIMKKRERAI